MPQYAAFRAAMHARVVEGQLCVWDVCMVWVAVGTYIKARRNA